MAFDKDKPAGTDTIASSDDLIRANNAALETALDQDHDFTTGGTQTGKHEAITLKEQASITTPSANEGRIACKEADGKSNLHWKDEDGTETQLTSAGKIRSAATDMLDEDNMASNSAVKTASQQSIKAYSDSGTQNLTNKTLIAPVLTSPVLNTGLSGTAFLDEDNMASDSATKAASQQSIKAYVDNSSKDGYTPTTYASEESITFPNGLIFKHGYKVRASDTTTVTFGAAFPTAVISAQVAGLRSAASNEYSVYVQTLSTSAMTVNAGSTYTGFYWQAWGR